jgi:PAS domain S-box-containing protein
MQQRVEQLRHSVRRPLTLSEALEEIATALAELSVAHEELRQQNEDLIETRRSLEAEQQRYKELFEFAPDGYLVTDAAGTIQEANRAAAAVLQVRPDFLVGKPLVVFIAEADRKALHTYLTYLPERTQPLPEWEVRLQPRAAEPFPAALTVAAVHNPQGQVVSLRWLLHDIIQRKHMEETLRESEARYRDLFDNANDAIATFTLDGVTTNVNRAAARMLGWSHEEMVGQHFSTFATPTSVALAEERTRRFLAGEKLPSATFEAELVRKDGSLLQVEAHTRALRDGDNKVIGFQGIYRDISARKQLEHELRTLNAELEQRVQERTRELADANQALHIEIAEHKRNKEALRESETLLNTILQTTQAVVYMLDADGRYVHVNRQFEEVVQMQNEAVRGKSVYDLFPPAVAAALDVNTRAVLASGTPLETEVILPHPDSQLHVYHSLKAPLRDATGALRGIVGVATDITARKQLEDALRQSEERYRRLAQEREQQLIVSDRRISFGELAASLAHEFNNPLGIILGFTQDLLKDVTAAHPLYSGLRIIETEAQRCKRLMERLRDFVRPTPMQLRWIDPAAVLRASLELVATQCRKQHVSTTLDLPPDLPQLYADPQQLQQILLNLFFNALEAMSRAGGTLTVRAMVTPSTAKMNGELDIEEMAITVTDTGTGITADHLGQIFRPFFTTKTKEGMGLGLSICESIMTAHGGRITVDSRVGQGTTFSLFFPVTIL